MKKSPTLKKKKFVPRELPLSEEEKKRLEEKNKPKTMPKKERLYGRENLPKRKTSSLKLKSRNVANATAKKTSPALAKLSASCKAAAKRKFKVYPSAYANMWASKTQKAGKC